MNLAACLPLSTILLHLHQHAAVEGTFLQQLPSILFEVLTNALEITGLVILMMALIEFINVSSSGKLMAKLRDYPFLQLVIACLLGAIPGCAGGFAVVSMFTHNALSLGALIGGMIATFGDEAFYLFVQSPRWGLILSGTLFTLGLCIGALINLITRKWKLPTETHEFDLHDEIDLSDHTHHQPHNLKEHILHFLKDHLWNHVVKQHLLSIFLWSFGVLLLLKTLGYFIDLETLMQTHEWAKYLLLLLAVLIGFIPESGPNLVFVILFLQGNIPFGILLANSISQNGHAGLPLLAQSRKNFMIVKTLTLLLGLLCGAVALLF